MRRDILIFGIIAGFIGNIPKLIITQVFHYFGWVKYGFIHIAAGYFVSKEYIFEPLSLATGILTDFFTAGLMGVLFLYIIRKTDNDYPVIKSLIMGVSVYIVLFGTFMALDLTRASLLTPLPNFLLIIPHTVLGLVVGIIIERYDEIKIPSQ